MPADNVQAVVSYDRTVHIQFGLGKVRCDGVRAVFHGVELPVSSHGTFRLPDDGVFPERAPCTIVAGTVHRQRPVYTTRWYKEVHVQLGLRDRTERVEIPEEEYDPDNAWHVEDDEVVAGYEDHGDPIDLVGTEVPCYERDSRDFGRRLRYPFLWTHIVIKPHDHPIDLRLVTNNVVYGDVVALEPSAAERVVSLSEIMGAPVPPLDTSRIDTIRLDPGGRNWGDCRLEFVGTIPEGVAR